MIVDTNAYVLSLIKVLLCCLIRDFLIPLLVWRKHLKPRSHAYRFWFCIITQASLNINLVLLLGFFRICNRYTIMGFTLVLYLLIAWNFSDKKFFLRFRKMLQNIGAVNKEEHFLRFALKKFGARWKDQMKTIGRWPLWNHLFHHWLESMVLGVLIVYNIWFLTHNVMLYHSYQFSDIPVHQSWIYALEHGNLFSEGIYPFGMHAMIYVIRAIFRLNLREIMLYAGAYQTVLLIIGLYLLGKELFHAKYSPIASVVILSLMLNQGRYAASLPQEAGMYAVVGLAYFMIRFLHTDRKKFVIESDTKLRKFFRINAYINRRYLSAEAILLLLCIMLVIAYHFYTAIAAIFLALAIGLAYLPKILKKQYFIPLMFCAIMGAFLAVAPFGACLMKGIPFQESMAWATSVIAGEEWKGSDTNYQAELAAKQGRDSTTDSSGSDALESAEEEKVTVDYSSMTLTQFIKFYYQAIFNFGILAMFNGKVIQLMFYCMGIGLICALLMLMRKKTRIFGHDYIALILYMLILCTLGASQQLGLIELIASARASSFAEPFIGLVFMLPVDFAFRLLGIWKNRYFQALLNVLSAAVCAGVAIIIIEFGWYHNFFDINQAYYNESEYVLRHIKKSFDHHSYTIVSPTEEYYDVLDYGYHTQISKFIDMVNGNQEEFTFPSRYVFFFIEKQVMQDYYYGPVDVNPNYAAMKFTYMANSQDYYFQRAIIESQSYYWAQKFRQIYPRNFKVYYEDDIYVVYMLEQNTYSPFRLRTDYLSGLVDEVSASSKEERNE